MAGFPMTPREIMEWVLLFPKIFTVPLRKQILSLEEENLTLKTTNFALRTQVSDLESQLKVRSTPSNLVLEEIEMKILHAVVAADAICRFEHLTQAFRLSAPKCRHHLEVLAHEGLVFFALGQTDCSATPKGRALLYALGKLG